LVDLNQRRCRRGKKGGGEGARKSWDRFSGLSHGGKAEARRSKSAPLRSRAPCNESRCHGAVIRRGVGNAKRVKFTELDGRNRKVVRETVVEMKSLMLFEWLAHGVVPDTSRVIKEGRETLNRREELIDTCEKDDIFSVELESF